jgi:hypothetical protein
LIGTLFHESVRKIFDGEQASVEDFDKDDDDAETNGTAEATNATSVIDSMKV